MLVSPDEPVKVLPVPSKHRTSFLIWGLPISHALLVDWEWDQELFEDWCVIVEYDDLVVREGMMDLDTNSMKRIQKMG